MIIDDLTPTLSDNFSDEIPVEQGTATLKTTWQKGLNLFVSSAGTPLMDGTAAKGTANALARSDHIHPTDTSRAAQADLVALEGKFKAITATLSTASWSSNQQTVTNAAFIASGYAYVVAPASASFLAYGESQIYADNVTTDGSMVFHCVAVPSSALTVNVMRMVAT